MFVGDKLINSLSKGDYTSLGVTNSFDLIINNSVAKDSHNLFKNYSIVASSEFSLVFISKELESILLEEYRDLWIVLTAERGLITITKVGEFLPKKYNIYCNLFY